MVVFGVQDGALLMIKRRDFIAGLGGAVVLPVAARAQQGERARRIGVLMDSTRS